MHSHQITIGTPISYKGGIGGMVPSDGWAGQVVAAVTKYDWRLMSLSSIVRFGALEAAKSRDETARTITPEKVQKRREPDRTSGHFSR
jgi:hypothetical protein